MRSRASIHTALAFVLAFASLWISSDLAKAGSPASHDGFEATESDRLRLGIGKDRFLFDGWGGPPIPVWTYIPSGLDPKTAPIAFIMHGARRDPDRYRDEWVDEADKGGFIVIAPGFAREDFPRANGYNLGAMRDAQTGEWRERTDWSFAAIEPLFDEVVSRLDGSQTHYTLYGHSAGSQFVHRFLFFMPDVRVKRYLPANAGWYTFPDPETPFPFGLGGVAVDEAQLQAALAKDVVILLGDEDTDSDHSALNRSDGAMQQGRHRFERGTRFFEKAKAMAERHGWDFGWRLRVVEGVAHSNDGMAKGAFDLIE